MPKFHMKTIHENERDYIIYVLKMQGKNMGLRWRGRSIKCATIYIKIKMKKPGIRERKYGIAKERNKGPQKITNTVSQSGFKTLFKTRPKKYYFISITMA